MKVTLTKTRCNKVQLEMSEETAKNLMGLVGCIKLAEGDGIEVGHPPSYGTTASIRTMCSDVYDPLIAFFKSST